MKMKVCAFGFGEADNKLHIANQLTGVHSMGGMNNPSREQLDLLLRDDGLDIGDILICGERPSAGPVTTHRTRRGHLTPRQ